jgi:hypothetical protein
MTKVNTLIIRENCPTVGGHHTAVEGLGFCYTEFEGTHPPHTASRTV